MQKYSPVSGSETASLQKVVLSKPIRNATLHWRSSPYSGDLIAEELVAITILMPS
jgi:hypothetical protein